jgi:hypothetical protein
MNFVLASFCRLRDSIWKGLVSRTRSFGVWTEVLLKIRKLQFIQQWYFWTMRRRLYISGSCWRTFLAGIVRNREEKLREKYQIKQENKGLLKQVTTTCQINPRNFWKSLSFRHWENSGRTGTSFKITFIFRADQFTWLSPSFE